jgi:hypothetical protein
VVFWLLLALLIEFRTGGRPGARGLLLQGLAIGQMLSCRPTAALHAGLFGLWVLYRAPGRAVLLGLLSLAAYLPWVLFYQTVYGNPVGTLTITLAVGGGSYWSLHPERFLGVLVMPARGFLVYQPWAWLALVPLVCRGEHSRVEARSAGVAGWVPYAVISILAQAWVVSSWHDWVGGHCWGSRLMTDVVPLMGLLAVPGVACCLRNRAGRLALVLVAVLGLSLHLPAITRNAADWNRGLGRGADVWSWTKAPFLHDGRSGGPAR